MNHTRYHEGGYDENAPALNIAELFDGAAGTYTAWDESGTQVTQRPLTSEEAGALVDDAPAPVPVTADAAALDAALLKVQNATTVAALRSAMSAALKALSTD